MGLGTGFGGDTAYLRGLQMLALTDSCEVGTLTLTEDDGGGATAAWSYAAAVSCRVDPVTGGESVVADRLSDRTTHIITLPAGTTVLGDSRLRVNAAVVYEVTAVRGRTGEQVQLVEAVPA